MGMDPVLGIESSQRSLPLERAHIRISWHFHSGFSSRYLFQHGQDRVPNILYRMEHQALARMADKALGDETIQKRPMIVRLATCRRIGGGHLWKHSVPVKDRYRAMKQASASHRVALTGECVMHIWEHLTTCKCRRCVERTVAVHKRNESAEQSRDPNFCLCMNCVDNGRKREIRTIWELPPFFDS